MSILRLSQFLVRPFSAVSRSQIASFQSTALLRAASCDRVSSHHTIHSLANMDQQQQQPRNNRNRNRRKRPAGSSIPDAASQGGRPRQKTFRQRAAAQAQAQAAKTGGLDPPETPYDSPAYDSNPPSPPPRPAPVVSPDAPLFSSLEGRIHPTILQTITEDLKFEHMTAVQAATISHLLEGGDVLAQAKTGTGKTVAFLLPAIQRLLGRPRSVDQKDISLLVISPTRELALQIAKDAKALLQRMPSIRVCTAIGGTNKDAEAKRIRAGCGILIATPGRLNDHLTTDGEDSEVRARLGNLNTLVLDEADRLLDMGFLGSLKDIVKCLPDRRVVPRQGMLFSATVADHVNKVTSIALDRDHKFISTIPEGEVGTHQRVPQHLVVVPNFSDMAAGLVGAVRAEMAVAAGDDTPFKVIVFCPTAALADFYADVLGAMPGLPPVSTLHARMTQSKRTRVTEDFRSASSAILVATDVVARGLDFPAVSNVFQAGLPSDKESYIHRLGRTGRAGAEGRGTFIVTSHEAFFPKRVMKDIEFVEDQPDLSAHEAVLAVAERLETHAKTYQSWLGFYKTHMKALRWEVEDLVNEAAALARDGLGAPETPSLARSTVGKMGLKGAKGLKVIPDPPRQGGHGRGGR